MWKEHTQTFLYWWNFCESDSFISVRQLDFIWDFHSTSSIKVLGSNLIIGNKNNCKNSNNIGNVYIIAYNGFVSFSIQTGTEYSSKTIL